MNRDNGHFPSPAPTDHVEVRTKKRLKSMRLFIPNDGAIIGKKIAPRYYEFSAPGLDIFAQTEPAKALTAPMTATAPKAGTGPVQTEASSHAS